LANVKRFKAVPVARLSRSRSLLLGCLLLGGVVVAQAVAAPLSPHEKAQELIAAAEADATSRNLTAGAIDNARKALGRASEARKQKAESDAQILDAAALTWAELGRDLKRAVESEEKAARSERELTELETKIDRAQALLEETVARQGRAQEKLKNIEAAQPAPKPGAFVK
jgi:hypothetical protein